MKYVDELIKKCDAKGKSGKYWVDLYHEVDNFLKGDYPEEDKKKITKYPIGILEKLTILYDGFKDDYE